MNKMRGEWLIQGESHCYLVRKEGLESRFQDSQIFQPQFSMLSFKEFHIWASLYLCIFYLLSYLDHKTRDFIVLTISLVIWPKLTFPQPVQDLYIQLMSYLSHKIFFINNLIFTLLPHTSHTHTFNNTL